MTKPRIMSIRWSRSPVAPSYDQLFRGAFATSLGEFERVANAGAFKDCRELFVEEGKFSLQFGEYRQTSCDLAAARHLFNALRYCRGVVAREAAEHAFQGMRRILETIGIAAADG